MRITTALRLITVIALTLCPFLGSKGGVITEPAPAGTITNLRGDVIFVSENASDRGEALQEAVRAGVKLQNASLGGITLRDLHLAGADLRGADFQGAFLDEVDLSGADLAHANFAGARLTRVSMHRANLKGVKLSVS